MTKHKIKYRVVGADRSKRKYAINLDQTTAFQLSKELLQGGQAQEGTQALCSFHIRSEVLWVKVPDGQDDILINGQRSREFEGRPGDLIQVGEFSIEILECPHTARDQTNERPSFSMSPI